MQVRLVPVRGDRCGDTSLDRVHGDIQAGDLLDQLVGDQHSMMSDWVADVELFEQVTGLGDGDCRSRSRRG